MKTLDIAYGLHDARGTYFAYTAVSMLSVLEHTKSPVCFHILCDATLTARAEEAMRRVAAAYGAKIRFYRLDPAPFEALERDVRNVAFFTIGALLRLKIDRVLSALGSCLYLDGDVIVMRDASDYWHDFGEDCSIGVVKDIKDTRCRLKNILKYRRLGFSFRRYFNSGVILFHLDRVRSRHDLWSEACAFLNAHRDEDLSPDQDALNYVFQDEAHFYDAGFNFIPGGDVLRSRMDASGGGTIHFAGMKPWNVRDTAYCEAWYGCYEKYLRIVSPEEADRILLALYARLPVSVEYGLRHGKVYSRYRLLKYAIPLLMKRFF